MNVKVIISLVIVVVLFVGLVIFLTSPLGQALLGESSSTIYYPPTSYSLLIPYTTPSQNSMFFGPSIRHIPSSNTSIWGVGGMPADFPVVNFTITNYDSKNHSIVGISYYYGNSGPNKNITNPLGGFFFLPDNVLTDNPDLYRGFNYLAPNSTVTIVPNGRLQISVFCFLPPPNVKNEPLTIFLEVS